LSDTRHCHFHLVTEEIFFDIQENFEITRHYDKTCNAEEGSIEG